MDKSKVFGKLRQKVQVEMGKKALLEDQITAGKKELRRLNRSVRLNEKARVVIQEAIRLTQEKLKHHLSDISSLAMASIFDDPYEVDIDFIPKRGKVETDIWFVRDGEQIHPLQSTGGGAIDICALSLRMSCWTLQNPKTRPILILDEPLKFLSRDLQVKASKLIKDISEKLDIQIIMNSHSPQLIECADNVIEVKMRKGRSRIKNP